MKYLIYAALFYAATTQVLFAQTQKTDAHIIGHVICCDEHLPYANVSIKGTTLGVLTDVTGHYFLTNVPEGEWVIVVSYVGYKTQEKRVVASRGNTVELNFELDRDVMGLNEVVVSGNRNSERKTETPVLIQSISPEVLQNTQSLSVGESLSYCTGLRLENNCQNCGFTQVRMNGMEGPYTQILINGRPIFSGLAGVYGLELIPPNMIERVEVIKGGGSAIYGGNAIAGSLNIILRDPISNGFEAGLVSGLTGLGHSKGVKPAADYAASFNTSLISDDYKTGMVLYGFSRERKMFDANSDGFSEIAPMHNLTLGTRIFHRFGYRNKVSLDFFNISEERNGGNRQDYIWHERDVSESVKHNIRALSLTYDQFFGEYDLLSVFAAGQWVLRDSYYGANRSLSDYGKTRDITGTAGINYKLFLGHSSITTGIDYTGGRLRDTKLGYPDIENAELTEDGVEIPHVDNTRVADQDLQTLGGFFQYELRAGRFSMYAGSRYDVYHISDNLGGNTLKSAGVFVPRLSVMYSFAEAVQTRLGYAKGYRTPQIFDEDLHIETSGSRQVININDPMLHQETSNSFTASLDVSKKLKAGSLRYTVDVFYTRLQNPFVNEIGEPDEQGVVIYTRRNAEGGASVRGINAELYLNFSKDLAFNAGFTYQKSNYDSVQEFDETRFFRAPDMYGFFTADYNISKQFSVVLTGTYTGPMLVPYFGEEADSEGELRTSQIFFDAGIKLSYSFRLNGADLQLLAGAKNIFDSYQNDFGVGVDRDPAYIYGPVSPRTVYLGIKLGNMRW